MFELNAVQNSTLASLVGNKGGFLKKPKSFYIYGNTGSGKTTVMEKYLSELQKTATKGSFLSMHFHDYLLDITKLLVNNSPKDIANKIAKNCKILCFDEFFIEAIADARILYDIFNALINLGVSIVLTSNFAPEDLYKAGFNREIMFPLFSNFLREKMEVIHICTSIDYRTSLKRTYKKIAFNNIDEFADNFKITPTIKDEQIMVDNNHTVTISGRFLNGVILSYENLFQRHSSIKDYRKLARTFQHIHISKMQNFTYENEDEAIRFRNFVDILYTRCMIVSFDGINSIDVFEENMLNNIKFKRCFSRLNEMQTQEYIFSDTKELKRQLTITSAYFFENLI